MLKRVAAKKNRWLAWGFFHGAGAGPDYSFQLPCKIIKTNIPISFDIPIIQVYANEFGDIKGYRKVLKGMKPFSTFVVSHRGHSEP